MSTPDDSAAVCAVCKKTATDANLVNLKKCSRCFSVMYCGAECQKADWKSHKPNCKPVAANTNASIATNPDQVRMDLERMRQMLLAQAQMNAAAGGHGHSHAPGQSCGHNHSHSHAGGQHNHSHSQAGGQHNHSHSHAPGQNHNHSHSHAPGQQHNHSHSHAPGQSCDHDHSHGDHGHAHPNSALDAAALNVAGQK